MLRPDLLIALGLVNWLVTLILVESEITKPIRDWLAKREDLAWLDTIYGSWRCTLWHKAGYLAGCHLCAGTWIGLLMGAVLPYRWPGTSGLVGAVLAGLTYKAVGHFTLEVVGRLKAHG